MKMEKYEELINNWHPNDEKGIELKNELERNYKEVKRLQNYQVLELEEFERREIEAEQAEKRNNTAEDFDAVDRFHNTYIPKNYYDGWVSSLNEVYKEIEKNYGLERKKRVEEKIKEFGEHSEKMKEEINKVKAELVLGDENQNFELTDAVKGLDSEFAELVAESDALIGEIDAFVNETGSADFSMTPAQIKNKVGGLGKRIRDLKQNLVHIFDARVALTNAKIAELKSRTDLTPEIAELINGLTELQLCGVTVQSWKHHSFLKDIDFNKLMEVNKLIADIEGKKIEPNPQPVPGPITPDVEPSNEIQHPMIKLDALIEKIELEILKLDSEVVPGLSSADLADKMQRLDDIETLINNFKLCLEHNKDSMPDEEYDKYVERIEDAIADVAELYSKLHAMDRGTGPEDDKDKDIDYKELSSKADKLSSDIDKLYDDVEVFKGLVVEGAISVFEMRLTGFEQELADLKKDIEDRKTAEKLDDNQYNNLINKVNAIEQKLKETKAKINDPGMVKGSDAFEVLTERVGKLKADVERLGSQVEELKGPIRDKITRNNIEASITEIDEKIKFLEDSLEVYKGKDVNKYNELKKELDDIKDKFDKTQEKYRKKCPRGVRAIKSAKKLYKKHPKLCLLAAGLAATALVHATVGPVLIPAIMHGNVLLMNAIPPLRPFFRFTNNILGRMINASIQTIVKGSAKPVAAWVLANGNIISPACTANALLKGIAISGISSTLMVAPLVVMIKELVEKMKKVDLKQKLNDTVKVGKESILKGKDKIVGVTKDSKDRVITAFKKDKKSIDELVKDFGVSGKTPEEFVAENGLNKNEQLKFYQALVLSIQKQNENQNEIPGRRRS